jgi:hypothetical protein
MKANVKFSIKNYLIAFQSINLEIEANSFAKKCFVLVNSFLNQLSII